MPSDSHTIRIPGVLPDSYDRVTHALSSLGYMSGNEIRYMGVRLGSHYNRALNILDLTILTKPTLLTLGYVEKQVREWLRGQGIKSA
jgi:hypothetical protein